MEQRTPKASLGQRWNKARPTKTLVFWSCVASVIVTMIVGFTWGGWVTGSTARSMATVRGEDAVVKRLAPICVVQSDQDPQKAEKLGALREVATWQQADYVKSQGWATMPGEQEAQSDVADMCAKLLMLASK